MYSASRLFESSTFWLASTGRFELNRSSFSAGGDASIGANGIVAGHVQLFRCRFQGPFLADYANVQQSLEIGECQFGPHPNVSSLSFQHAKIGGNLTLHRCEAQHGLNLEGSDIEGPLLINLSRINGSEVIENLHRICLNAENASINSVTIYTSQFSGAVAFNSSKIEHTFLILNSRFMPIGVCDLGELATSFEANTELSGRRRLFFDGVEIRKAFNINDSFVFGPVTLAHALMKVFSAHQTMFACSPKSVSLNLVSVQGSVDLGLSSCAISSGLDLSRGAFHAIGIGGCDIGPSASQEGNEWAIGSDDIQCETDFRIFDWQGRRTHIRGRVYIRSSTIGSLFQLGGVTIELTENTKADGWGGSLFLSDTKVQGDVTIGPTFANFSPDPYPEVSKPAIDGAVSFLDAVIDGNFSVKMLRRLLPMAIFSAQWHILPRKSA